MPLRDMLGAVRASVQAARAESRAGSETCVPSLGAAASEVRHTTDVPDLEDLKFLGTDRRGREVAETVNLHWKAYAKRF